MVSVVVSTLVYDAGSPHSSNLDKDTKTFQYFFYCFDTFDFMHILSFKSKKRKVLLSVKCFEHFFEASPNKLAAFKLVAKFLQESNLKGIGIFTSNITVITLNEYRKRAKCCCVHVFLVSS